ncbi:hypothetical protein VC838_25025, partial [Citrobacter freundii]|nr:hypothetical protein [Citrobacter freundii]
MSRTRLLPRLDNLPGLNNLRKTTCQGGFFVSRQRDYASDPLTVKFIKKVAMATFFMNLTSSYASGTNPSSSFSIDFLL